MLIFSSASKMRENIARAEEGLREKIVQKLAKTAEEAIRVSTTSQPTFTTTLN